eukprot:TRINITY_DN67959_c0_g1_i1.p1 TRINITY_DN67959_c0_g1~~TRINITY_DN67959_c0_g1_i1.p1  ORF type:complete len:298 (-),score=40.72 TRINITY_DN67959_c0_g1_i1:708-1601(-)
MTTFSRSGCTYHHQPYRDKSVGCVLLTMSRFSCVTIAAVLLTTTAHYDPSRTHIVAHNPTTSVYLFRGNMPTNDTAFVYDQLLDVMRQRAAEANVSFPSTAPFLVDMSLNNPFDEDPHETAFFADPANAKLGRIIKWPTGLSTIVSPYEVPAALLKEMAEKGIWELDDVPDHVDTIIRVLSQPPPTGMSAVAIYVHCTAGCDRTGEVIGSFRMRFERAGAIAPGIRAIPTTGIRDVFDMYQLDTSECGRSPNWFATTGLEWYCLYMHYQHNVTLGPCEGFADCKTFGKCKPIPRPSP